MRSGPIQAAVDALKRGDLASAREHCHRALQVGQTDPLPWRLLGAVDAAAGDLPAARRALLRSLAIEPAQGEAIVEMARIDLAEGNREEAIAGFRRAVALGGTPEILVRAGEGLGNLGLVEEAETCFRRALAQEPGMAAARFNLGLARLSAGDARAGRALLSQLVADKPGLAPAWLHLGGALNALGCYREAVEAFEQVLRLVPDDPRALAWMGASFQFLGDFRPAEKYYRKALRAAPEFSDAHANLGKLLHSQGRPAEAEQHFRQALRVDPGHLGALSGLAARLDNQGRYGEALRLLENPSVDNRSHQLAPIYARLLRHVGRSEHARAVLEEAAAREHLPEDARVQLDFSLAAVADEQADYELAWELAVRANRRRRESLPDGLPTADLDAVESAARQIKAVFTAETMGRLPSSGCLSERPVFIIGMPRSGKSLVEQILCSHSSVFGAGELTALGELSSAVTARVGQWPASATRVSEPFLEDLAQTYLRELDDVAGADALRVTDTMPFNFVHVGLIQMLFPRARVVSCVRHPMDLALRCFFKNFAGRSLNFAFALEDIVRYYLMYRELMSHWTSVTSIRMHVLRYESLVTDTATETARLLEFLDLPWDSACLRYFEPGVATSVADTVIRSPVHDREVGAWRHYKEPLAEVAGRLPVREYESGGF